MHPGHNTNRDKEGDKRESEKKREEEKAKLLQSKNERDLGNTEYDRPKF